SSNTPNAPLSLIKLNVTQSQLRYLSAGQVLLVKQYVKQSNEPELYLHILTDTLPSTDTTINPACTANNYVLLDRYGNRIDSLNNNSYLKVIQSGNQNSQLLFASTVTSF